MNEHIPNKNNFEDSNDSPHDEFNIDAFSKFEALAHAQEDLVANEGALAALAESFRKAEIAPELHGAAREELVQTHEYLEMQIAVLKRELNPPDATRIRKVGRGLLNLFKRD